MKVANDVLQISGQLVFIL